MQGNRPKRKGVRTVQNGSAKVILLGGGGLPAWARKKNEKYSELRDGRHRDQGQERELCPILHLVGEALHCSTPPTPKRPKQKKKKPTDRGRKKWFGEGLVREIQKQNDGHTTGGGFIAYHVPLFPLFPAHPLPLDRNIFHLAQKKFWVLWPVLGYTVPRQDNQQFP
jgi:hypothetical protein